MDQSHVLDLIEDLSDGISDLKYTLKPLSKNKGITAYASTLPLLDRAKLYTAATYAIHTTIFNHLQLAGHDAKNHAVMTELTRVKQQFERISYAENPGMKTARGAGGPASTVDTAAAGRFISHGKATNDYLNRQIAAGAKRNLDALNAKQAVSTGKKRKFDEEGEYLPDATAAETSQHDGDRADSGNPTKNLRPFFKKASGLASGESSDAQQQSDQQFNKLGKKARRNARRRLERQRQEQQQEQEQEQRP